MPHLRFRYGAHCLLAASLAMVIETSCSHAPREHQPVATSMPWTQHMLLHYEGQHEVVRIYDESNTVVATSDYSVTDSTVVVRELLKDGKYYPADDTAVLRQLEVPFEIPLNHIANVERWEKPQSTWKLAGVVVLVGAAFWAIGRYVLDEW